MTGIPFFKFVRQYGFTTGAGLIQNVVDGSHSTFYQPLATDFSSYTDQFLLPDGSLNYGKPFPAIEYWGASSDHDPVIDQHLTSLIIDLAGSATLGPAIVIGSNNQASSVSDTLQSGDVLLGQFTQAQMTSKKLLVLPAMQTGNTKFKFYRILQRSTSPSAAPPDPNVGSNFQIIDTPGSFTIFVPTYSGQWIMELWGPGATGGDNTGGADGAAATTIAAYSLSAGPGKHSTASGPNGGAAGATGGVATGGNTANVNGNPGQSPSPNSTAIGLSGPGGSAPFGGAGGDAATPAADGPVPGIPAGARNGLPGKAPGGGGSGLNGWSNITGGIALKYPGGGSGAYVKHVLTFGSGGPTPGSTISFVVGAGGVPPGVGSQNGAGANGRVKFSWT
jgi:hypothetical protein